MDGKIALAPRGLPGESWIEATYARTEAEPIARRGRELAAAQGKIVARAVEETVEVFGGTAGGK